MAQLVSSQSTTIVLVILFGRRLFNESFVERSDLGPVIVHFFRASHSFLALGSQSGP